MGVFHASKKTSSAIGAIKRIRQFLCQKAAEKIYAALFKCF